MAAKLLITLISISIISCHKNPVYKDEIGKIKTVVILGNSIVFHPKDEKIGWNNNWGMAATCRDSDLVHRLIAHIHSKDKSVNIKFKNIADFERGFWNYDLSKLDTFKKPDILILELGGNINDKNAVKKNLPFYLRKLVKNINPKVTVITDSFWMNEHVNVLVKKYAQNNDLPFLQISDLSTDCHNKAIGQFKYKPIEEHPNDRGMRLIADRIWNYISVYFA